MNPRIINTAMVALITLILSTSYLLDGPSEMDAMQATADSVDDAIKSAATQASNTPARGQKDFTADSVDDAIKSAATQASNTPARGQKDFKTVVAGVKP